MGEPTFSVEAFDDLVGAPLRGTLAVIGPRAALLDPAFLRALPEELGGRLPAVVARLTPGDAAAATTLWLGGEPPTRVDVAVLPDRVSRHNATGRPDQVEAAVRRSVATCAAAEPGEPLTVLVACARESQVLAAALAAARAVPGYSRKAAGVGCGEVRLALHLADGAAADLRAVDIACAAARRAAYWVDTPAAELHAGAFVDAAEAVAREVGAGCRVISGEALRDRGFGGLWNVGRGADHPPALVVLSHPRTPPADQGAEVWVGKGIVYDSGGLSLKSNAEMAGMKGDMGGAAAVLAAFEAAVRLGVPGPLHAVLCVAENCIGPSAMRPDDVLTLYSGKSVEVRNTDCEGRLVLGDGVAYAAQHLNPSRIVDLATLTDGAVVATGRRCAAILSNDAVLEAAVVAAGCGAGELVHPLPYLPELHRAELQSEVADMTNAARDPNNANASCAGHFVESHLGDYTGAWLHVDLEGPARADNGRGTGFGVGLLLRLLGVA